MEKISSVWTMKFCLTGVTLLESRAVLQMMWSSTVQIGCGSGTCNGKTIVTCHYLSAGNSADTPMFSEDNYNQLVGSGEKMDRCTSS